MIGVLAENHTRTRGPQALPKSPLGQAIAYALRQWAALLQFTERGFLDIDNNASERALSAVAVGRKNWLFAGSDTGGRTAAVLYTLTQTCRRHGIDPFAYLQDVFGRLPATSPGVLSSLLPHRWTAQPMPRLARSTTGRRPWYHRFAVFAVRLRKVGGFMRKTVFEPGRSLPWNDLMVFATGEKLSAKAYAADFRG